MHFSNRILPEKVSSSVSKDDIENWGNIAHIIDKLSASQLDVVDENLFNALNRAVCSRFALKYEFSVDQKSAVARLLISLYTERRMSFPMKVNTVSCLGTIFKKKSERLHVDIPWRHFWNEARVIM